MTANKDFKKHVRERQLKTGESYTTARAHVMRERARLALETPKPPSDPPIRVDAVVLKVNQDSARVRILGEEGQVTFRSGDVRSVDPVAPGHLVTLAVGRRWTWRGDAYASGGIENPRIDIGKLELVPLPLEGGELDDIGSIIDPYEPPDPYAKLWKKLTAKPRPSFEFDPIAWGEFPGTEPDENLTCNASELREAGDDEGARRLLMEALGIDLRCIDAHAHLGNLEFDRSPERAMVHYEIGIRIGELSLPPGFDGLLDWGGIFNRPFLRCLNGHGLCLWRLGDFAAARRVFERLLSFSPNDNMGARFNWHDVVQGHGWQP